MWIEGPPPTVLHVAMRAVVLFAALVGDVDTVVAEGESASHAS